MAAVHLGCMALVLYSFASSAGCTALDVEVESKLIRMGAIAKNNIAYEETFSFGGQASLKPEYVARSTGGLPKPKTLSNRAGKDKSILKERSRRELWL